MRSMMSYNIFGEICHTPSHAKEAHPMKHHAEHHEAARRRRHTRRRTPLMIKLLASVGLITLLVLFLRYLVIPVLVLLEGVV